MNSARLALLKGTSGRSTPRAVIPPIGETVESAAQCVDSTLMATALSLEDEPSEVS